MARTAVFAAALVVVASIASATTMKPSGPEKMTSPTDKQKMKACQDRATAQNVPMADRSKFVMDCMTQLKN